MDDNQLVRILKALADPKRLRMAQAIAEAGEMPCGEWEGVPDETVVLKALDSTSGQLMQQSARSAQAGQ